MLRAALGASRLLDLERLGMRAGICIMAILAASVGFGAALEAQAPQLAMLDRLDRGAWEVRPRDAEEERVKVCLSTGRELIQLKHARLACNRVVVDDSQLAVTVQYSCPGNGYGRTHIRMETDRLVQIDTQGIERGLPFAFGAEARWVGACPR